MSLLEATVNDDDLNHSQSPLGTHSHSPRPSLPIELSDRIIDLISTQRPTLVSCALVCKNWSYRSNYHLWRAVLLASACRTVRFLLSLELSPRLGTLVQSLTLEHDTLLAASICVRLTALKKLKIVGAHYTTHQSPTTTPRTLATGSALSPTAWFHASSVTDLTLRGCNFESSQSLRVFVCMFISLTELTMQEVKVDDIVAVHRSLPTGLREIKLIDIDWRCLEGWSFTSALSIRIEVKDALGKVRDLNDLLACAGRSVKSIHLRATMNNGHFLSYCDLSKNTNLRYLSISVSKTRPTRCGSNILALFARLAPGSLRKLSLKLQLAHHGDGPRDRFPWDSLDEMLASASFTDLRRVNVRYLFRGVDLETLAPDSSIRLPTLLKKKDVEVNLFQVAIV